MTLFALPIIIILLLFSVILLLFKRWKLASALTVVALILNWYWEVCPMHFFSNEDPSDKTFRVVTYNIYPQVDSTQYDRWQRDMLKEIERLHPDILCLQEFKIRDFSWLESELCKYFCYSENMIQERKKIKWRLYSRYPMSNITRYKPSEDLDSVGLDPTFSKSIANHTIRQPYYSADILLPSGDIVTVFSCHLMSNAYSRIRRSMDDGESWFDGISQYTEAIQTAERIRVWEAKNLRHILDSIGNGHPLIIAGDFNDFNQSKSMRIIQADNLYDAWWKGGRGMGFTYSGFNLKLRLDHILYNNHLQLHHVELDNSELSDHLPLVADFSLNNK